jgi:carbon-monoxide dehydrogenase small subunit
MQAAFEGLASLTKDETNKTAILNGTGQDRLSQSRASGTISYRIESIGNQSSRVHIDMTYGLQGPLAQFSRSGMVKDFVRRMMKIFAQNIEHSLINPGRELSNQQKNLRPIALFFGIIWDRLRALFSIKSRP